MAISALSFLGGVRAKNQIEFRFFGAGGAATGPFGISVFLILAICAMILIGYLAFHIPTLGSAITWVARIRGP